MNVHPTDALIRCSRQWEGLISVLFLAAAAIGFAARPTLSPNAWLALAVTAFGAFVFSVIATIRYSRWWGIATLFSVLLLAALVLAVTG